jgi:hypothetical protein
MISYAGMARTAKWQAVAEMVSNVEMAANGQDGD